MKIFRKVSEWQTWRAQSHVNGQTLGFVPTMGALHDGHSSLVKKSWDETDLTFVTIFVNPTQFNDPEDFKKYPQDLEADLKRLENDGADLVLIPEAAEIYRDDYRYQVNEGNLSKILCGPGRPGHFQGMLTVVLKLLNLAQADRAYFGEKDFQQYLLIKGMAESFFLKTEIIPCPIIREEDGLAMSSRNQRLSKEDRLKAAVFPRLLSSADDDVQVAAALAKNGFTVDYVQTIEGRRFGAVQIGSVRLIDNVLR